MAFGGTQRKEFKNASDGYERIPHNRNNYEDGMKLETRIFKKTGQNLRETLLRYLNVDSEDEKCHEELLSTPEWRIKKVEPMMNKNLKAILEKACDWCKSFLRHTLKRILV